MGQLAGAVRRIGSVSAHKCSLIVLGLVSVNRAFFWVFLGLKLMIVAVLFVSGSRVG